MKTTFNSVQREAQGFGIISTNIPRNEGEIKAAILSMKPLLIAGMLDMIISPCGRKVENTSPIYFFQQLLIGLEERDERYIRDYFSDSSPSETIAWISLALLNYTNDPDKETFSREYVEVFRQLIDLLTAWDHFIKDQNWLKS